MSAFVNCRLNSALLKGSVPFDSFDSLLYEAIRRIAKKEGISISLKARDLLREALEIHEDIILNEIASEREKTFRRKKALTHDERTEGVGP